MCHDLKRDQPASAPYRKRIRKVSGGAVGAKPSGRKFMGTAELEWEFLIKWGLLKSPFRWTISHGKPRIFPD